MKADFKLFIRIFFYGGFLLFVSIKSIEAYNNRGGFNGFDVGNSLVPVEQILKGGPSRDGIPAIDEPVFHIASRTENIRPDSRVLGIHLNGKAKAYPIDILNWHEIVNDKFNGQPVTISYCPLCGTGMAFKTSEEEGFGVSGLLYNSDMLLYDRKSESLWSQIKKTAISGLRQGEKLTSIPLMHTDWQSWQAQYPESLLLSRETAYRRNYDESPYLGYDTSENLFFPITHEDKRYPKKASIIGLSQNDKQKVWPLSELNKATSPLTDTIDDLQVLVHFDAEKDHAWLTDNDGNLLPAVRGYWFAWMAFYPNSEVFTR